MKDTSQPNIYKITEHIVLLLTGIPDKDTKILEFCKLKH